MHKGYEKSKLRNFQMSLLLLLLFYANRIESDSIASNNCFFPSRDGVRGADLFVCPNKCSDFGQAVRSEDLIACVQLGNISFMSQSSFNKCDGTLFSCHGHHSKRVIEHCFRLTVIIQ
jgi:hypothetical protein